MAFKRDDIYTSSGSVMLFNSWTPTVAKFDTSSFYSWEQDNLPLYDLEERTYELWEQAGFPTSSVPGFALSVSAETPTLTLQQDSTIFTDLSSCIAAIPKVIRFPVLVEVANFGDLGKLELHNLRIEESGSLEIINRGFARVYNVSAQGLTNVTPTQNASVDLINTFISADLSATLFSGIGDDACTSALDLSTTVLSSAGDARVNSVNSFLYPKLTSRQAPLAVALKNAALLTSTEHNFSVNPYENTVDTAEDATLGTLDISAVDQYASASTKRTEAETGDLGGAVYTNFLTELSVKNCNGPIYLRNFCVNGETTPTSGRLVGVNIVNSDVILENCAATRCREAGFKFNNSKVVLSRSAFAYRNYDLTSTTNRRAKTGIGFHAINSDVSVSALLYGTVGDVQASGHDVTIVASRNYAGFKLDNSKLTGSPSRLTLTDEDTAGIVTSELNTGPGFLLNHSEVDLKGLVDAYANDVGIQAESSKVVFENLCVEANNNEGIKAKNSTFLFDSANNPLAAGQAARKQVEFLSNGQHLVLSKQSDFSFERKDHIPDRYGNTFFTSAHGVIAWDGEVQANLPAVSIEDNSSADLLHSKIITRGISQTVANSVDYGLAIRAINNSKLSLFGTKTGCSFVWGPEAYNKQQHAAGLYARNNSQINLHGPTVIAQFGVDALVENNSVLNIEPPTQRSGYGLEVSAFDLSGQGNHTSVELHATRACLVANQNSVINMNELGSYAYHWPGSTNGDTILAAGTDYPSENFDNSAFVAYGSLQFYPNPQDSTVISNNNLDDILVAGATGAQNMKSPIASLPVFTNKTGMNTLLVTDDPLGGSPTLSDRGLISKGGVCVRATGDSVVNVNNVHFPHGNNGGFMNGHYYDASGSDCDHLMIWNMADTSRLNAAYCSVSGEYPSEIAYYGPSALYVSSDSYGATSLTYVPAHGCPEGTPDTGALSVLDMFGAGSAVWVIPSGVDFNSTFDRYYPVSGVVNDETARLLGGAGINVSSTTTLQYGLDGSANNHGPFRIYWSPKPSAKLLQTDMSGYTHGSYPHSGGIYSGVVGPAYQLFAQGYNLSAPVSAVLLADGTNASALYPELLKFSYDSDGDGKPDSLWTSGYYYCSEFVEDNPTQCMLDESAAETFANAKNAAVGSSGRPKKVTLYRSRADDTNSGSAPANRGSEAYQGDEVVGFKSANIFDLRRDN